ncbi:MAG: dethiobiotin synthase [Verrucomicrobia bacterium]|nr:dethiobiotin synthase [Verrucomicrobiota bacterium]
MKGGVFITGTDTGVGKTWVTTRLLRELRGRGRDVVGMKPVECGGREDGMAIHEASGRVIPLDSVNPVSLAEPVAPAAATGPVAIDFGRITACFEALAGRHEFVLVEGAGGWLVPVDPGRTMADLAVALGLPVVLVARNRLGVLNHALLTVRAIETSGLECRAIYLNPVPDGEEASDRSRTSNARVLREQLPGIPVIEDDPTALAELLP